MTNDHDWEHLKDAYRDAVAYIECHRVGDGVGMDAVWMNTVCDECFVGATAKIAMRPGDREAVQAAASDALEDLQRRSSDDGPEPEGPNKQ